MENRHSITVTAHGRPALLKRALASILANDLSGWRLVVRIEPGTEAATLVAVVKEMIGDREHSLAVNERQLGIRENPFRTIEQAFAEGSVLNLALEEDLVVSPDATAMALWFLTHHQPQWLCLSLLAGPCGSTSFLSDPRYPDLLFESRTFNSLGFAVRRQEWESHMRGAWMGDGSFWPRMGFGAWRHHWGWDWSIYALLASGGELRSVQPVLARATHIGREGGTNTTTHFHDRAFGGLAVHDKASAALRLVPVADLPTPIRSHVNAHSEITALRLELETLARRPRRWRRLLLGER